jgi:N-acetylglucosaminyldiphosphoundecaprenol N-acetyl-beta-D-mannosaminyltransferase
VDFVQTIAQIDQLISRGQPQFVITANLHYAMLSASDSQLQRNNERAAMILADGMPMYWASCWRSRPLPERVAGSDLVPALCELSTAKGYGAFLLGAAPGIAEEAKRKLIARFPNLRIVGVESPPFRTLSPTEEELLIENIRAAKPDLLFVAFGQPKGEYWVAENCERLGVPVVMQVGATLDFLAGHVKRSPRWMQRIGCEWLYRFTTDPRRLGPRYVSNMWFAFKMTILDALTRRRNRR